MQPTSRPRHAAACLLLVPQTCVGGFWLEVPQTCCIADMLSQNGALIVVGEGMASRKWVVHYWCILSYSSNLKVPPEPYRSFAALLCERALQPVHWHRPPGRHLEALSVTRHILWASLMPH